MTLSPLELAAFIASKLCHDIISPVGAISNGMEILEEDKDPEMRKIAMDLSQKSAAQALAKLQYMRICFGAAGSHGADFDLRDAERLVTLLFEHEKAEIDWNVPACYSNKDKVRLLLNLVMAAAASIPRGGTIRIDMEGSQEDPSYLLTAEGKKPKISEELIGFVKGDEIVVNAQNVQYYYIKLLSDLTGMQVELGLEGETVTMRTKASGPA